MNWLGSSHDKNIQWLQTINPCFIPGPISPIRHKWQTWPFCTISEMISMSPLSNFYLFAWTLHSHPHMAFMFHSLFARIRSNYNVFYLSLCFHQHNSKATAVILWGTMLYQHHISTDTYFRTVEGTGSMWNAYNSSFDCWL